MDKKRKSDVSLNRTYGRLYTNFTSAAKLDRNGASFINFCIDYLAKLDHRSLRFIMCDLLMAGLKHSERYGSYFSEMESLFQERSQAEQV